MNSTLSNTTAMDRVLHDVRAVHDAAILPFALDNLPDAKWLIMRITPAPDSGAAESAGTAVDIQSGQVVDTTTGQAVSPRAAPLALKKSGRWELVSALAPSVLQRNGTYAWGQPLLRGRCIQPEDLYSPFITGGIALCRHHSHTSGSKEFDPVYLLPPHWGSETKEAYDTIGRQPVAVQAQLSGGAGPTPMRFVSRRNSVLATMTFRYLLQGSYDNALLQTVLLGWSGFRKGVAIYVAAASPVSPWENVLETLIGASTEQASSLDDVKLVVVALLAINFFRPDVGARRPWLRSIELSLRDRTIAADEYLTQALALVGGS